MAGLIRISTPEWSAEFRFQMFDNQPYSVTPVAPAASLLSEPFCTQTQEF
jgi:hypothetical protein